jgi:ABC-type ATPase with predicted acetyltransferase domain
MHQINEAGNTKNVQHHFARCYRSKRTARGRCIRMKKFAGDAKIFRTRKRNLSATQHKRNSVAARVGKTRAQRTRDKILSMEGR